MPRTLTVIVFVLLIGLAMLVLLDAVRTSFVKLGVPSGLVGLVIFGSIIGSAINIPLWERTAGFVRGGLVRVGAFIYYQPPHVERQIVAINVGGGVIPILLSGWLLFQAPIWKVLVAMLIVVAITHASAKVVPGRGIQMPFIIAPLTSALLAALLTIGADRTVEAAPIAYVAGSMGTLIGADLLNLRRLSAIGHGVLSIGGAGVFDGVFLVGIVAAFLT